MTHYVGVLGTHGWTKDPRRAWWMNDSPFNGFLRKQGVEMAFPYRPFVWSGDLEGVPLVGSGNDWEAGAEALCYYLDGLSLADRNVIAHSHGGQVALMAAAQGLKLRSLVMVATPVRESIEARIAPAAAKNIDRCVHLCDARFDYIGLAGAFFDWRWSLRRTFNVPGIDSRKEPGIGHSNVLYDPTKFAWWLERGWLDVLRGTPAAAV